MASTLIVKVYGKDNIENPPQNVEIKSFIFQNYNYNFTIQVGFNKIKIFVILKTRSVYNNPKKVNFSAIINPYEKRNSIEESFFYAIEKGMLLHILIHGYGLQIGRIEFDMKGTVDNTGKIIKHGVEKGESRYSMITGWLPRKIPESISGNETFTDYLLKSKRYFSDATHYSHFENIRSMDYRPASIYAYLLGKSRLTEFESFIYFWMAIASLMNHYQHMADPEKDKTDKDGFLRLSEHYHLLEKTNELCGASEVNATPGYLIFSKGIDGKSRKRYIAEIEKSFSELVIGSETKWELEDKSFDEILEQMRKQMIKSAQESDTTPNPGKKYTYLDESKIPEAEEEDYATVVQNSLDEIEGILKKTFSEHQDEEAKRVAQNIRDKFKRFRKEIVIGETSAGEIVQKTNYVRQTVAGPKCPLTKEEKEFCTNEIKNLEGKIKSAEKDRKAREEGKVPAGVQRSYDIDNWYYDILHYEEEDSKERLYEIMLLELPYYFRNNYFHTGKLLPIIETKELAALRVLRIVIEGFLDEKLSEAELYL